MTRAIIFDMDGLMFDTERLFQIAWGTVGRRMGYADMHETFYDALGINEEANIRLLHGKYGSKFPYAAFRRETSDWVHAQMAQHGVPKKPGLVELLTYGQAHGLRMAVATSTSRSRAMPYLEQAGVAPMFDTIICGDMVTRGKPAPDIYLKAAETLGVPPGKSMALEDSFNGIRSAHAAGLKPVMVPDILPPSQDIQQMLYREVPSLLCVIDLLEEERVSTGG